MASRAGHERAKAQHAQREFGAAKAKLQPVGTDTAWLSTFLSSCEGIGPFNLNSIIALQLGGDPQEREQKLRLASSMGLLRMSAYRENGVFIEYRWELA